MIHVIEGFPLVLRVFYKALNRENFTTGERKGGVAELAAGGLLSDESHSARLLWYVIHGLVVCY